MRRLIDLVRRFEREERGIAAVEFALILPFLIALYFGSLEASAAFTADKRVNSISSTIGDLVAQWDPAHDGTLTTGSGGVLPAYFSASTGLITPYPSAGVKILMTLIWVKSDGTSKVIWSKANDPSITVHPQGSSFTPLYTSGTTPTQMNIVAQGGCIIASEVSYSYKPLLGVVFDTALNLSHTNYFIPRYGATNTIIVDNMNPAVLATACKTGVYR